MRSVKDFQETQKLIDEYKSYNDKIPELENKIEINNKKSAVKIERLEEQLKMTYSDAEFEIDRESLQQGINNQIEKEKESLEAENLKVEEEIKENKENSKYFRTDANIKTITMEIKEMQKEVQKYKLELAKKEIELQEFYAEGEEHEDPLKCQKIYKEKDELNKNINELTAKIEEYTKFKEELLSIELTADEYKKMFARETEKQNKDSKERTDEEVSKEEELAWQEHDDKEKSNERTETKEEKETTKKWMNGEDIEKGTKKDRTRKTIDPNLHKDVVTPELKIEPKKEDETQKTAEASKEIDEVLQKYKNEGFGQNALGWYFNPWIDEYDATYDPHNDASYNPNIKKEEKEDSHKEDVKTEEELAWKEHEDKNVKTEEEIRKEEESAWKEHDKKEKSNERTETKEEKEATKKWMNDEEAEVIDNQDKNNNLPAKKENIFKKLFNKIFKKTATYMLWKKDIENLKAEDFKDSINSMSNIKNNVINSNLISDRQKGKLVKIIDEKHSQEKDENSKGVSEEIKKQIKQMIQQQKEEKKKEVINRKKIEQVMGVDRANTLRKGETIRDEINSESINRTNYGRYIDGKEEFKNSLKFELDHDKIKSMSMPETPKEKLKNRISKKKYEVKRNFNKGLDSVKNKANEVISNRREKIDPDYAYYRATVRAKNAQQKEEPNIR